MPTALEMGSKPVSLAKSLNSLIISLRGVILLRPYIKYAMGLFMWKLVPLGWVHSNMFKLRFCFLFEHIFVICFAFSFPCLYSISHNQGLGYFLTKTNLGMVILYPGWSFCTMTHMTVSCSQTGKSQMYKNLFHTVFNFFKLFLSSSRKDSSKKSSLIYFVTLSINLLDFFKSSLKHVQKNKFCILIITGYIGIFLLSWQSRRGHQHLWVWT